MKSTVVAAGALYVMALVACGGDSGQPPLAITQQNATAVAGEVLVGAGQLTSGGGLGGLSVAPTTVVALTQPQLTRMANHVRRLPGRPVSAAPQTEDCAFGGTMTVTQNSETSAKVSYSQCEENDGVVMNGSVSASISVGNNTLSISASLDLTITIGSVVVAESGDLELKLSSGDSNTFDLTSDHLTASIKNGSTVVDEITLSNLSIHLSTTTSGGQSVSTASERYDVDSSKLKGSFTVETTADVTADAGASYAFGGSLTITGANGSTLKITIQGDESSTPATGEGQIKLEVNGSVVWTNWADLAAASDVGA